MVTLTHLISYRSVYRVTTTRRKKLSIYCKFHQIFTFLRAHAPTPFIDPAKIWHKTADPQSTTFTCQILYESIYCMCVGFR